MILIKQIYPYPYLQVPPVERTKGYFVIADAEKGSEFAPLINSSLILEQDPIMILFVKLYRTNPSISLLW